MALDHIERVEAALEELRLYPDRVIHEAYLAYALHECIGLASLTSDQRQETLHQVALECHRLLCPSVAVGVADNDIYLLVQQNPERSADDIAQAAGTCAVGWKGDYSLVSIGAEDVEEIADAVSAGDVRAKSLFSDLAEE